MQRILACGCMGLGGVAVDLCPEIRVLSVIRDHRKEFIAGGCLHLDANLIVFSCDKGGGRCHQLPIINPVIGNIPESMVGIVTIVPNRRIAGAIGSNGIAGSIALLRGGNEDSNRIIHILLQIADIADIIPILILMVAHSGYLSALTNALEIMADISRFGIRQGLGMGLIIFVVLVIMFGLQREIIAFYLIAGLILNKAAIIIGHGAGILGSNKGEIRPLEILARQRLSVEGIINPLAAFKIGSAPGIGQLPFTNGLDGCMSNIALVIILIRAAHINIVDIGRLLGDHDGGHFIIADIAIAICISVFMRKKMGGFIAPFANARKDMAVFAPLRKGAGALMGFEALVIMIIMGSRKNSVLRFGFVAILIGDDAADGPWGTAGIGMHNEIQIRPLIVFIFCGLAIFRKGLIDSLPAGGIFSAPGIGQRALAHRFHAEMGDISLVIVLIGAEHPHIFYIFRLLQDLNFRIAHITAGDAVIVGIKGMGIFIAIVRAILAIMAAIPMVGIIPAPCRDRSCPMGIGRRGMHLSKMRLPMLIFNAYPFGAIAALKGGKIHAADQAEAAIIANPFAFGAIFAAVEADIGAIGARAAIGADINAIAAKIAVFAKSIGATAAFGAAILADNDIIGALVAIGAMEAAIDGAFNAKLAGAAIILAVGADIAIHAIFAVALPIAFGAIGAMEIIIDGAIGADNGALPFGAEIADGGAIIAF